MNNGGEAADQMVREALQFSEVAIKLTALGFKNSLAIALAYAKENPKVRGKTSLDRLLREGKEMKIIPLQTKDLAQFKACARCAPSHRLCSSFCSARRRAMSRRCSIT